MQVPKGQAVDTGWEPINHTLPAGGLARGVVHEWLGVGTPSANPTPARHNWWMPPAGLLVHLARRAVIEDRAGAVLWIGHRLWPYPHALAGDSLLANSTFVRAPDAPRRLWAADLALRSRAPCAVIADGSGFDLTATRRLQLAAEAGGGLCLLARPPWEESQLSAAATRWRIRSSPSPAHTRRWTIELIRCKGVQPDPAARRFWTLEQDHATRCVVVAPNVVDRPGRAQAPAGRHRFG